MPLDNLISIIFISAIITERLLEGLHRFYWTRQLKIYLVGEDKAHLVGEKINTGIVQIPWLREFIRCKFCQSFWMGWMVSLLMFSLPPCGTPAFIFSINRCGAIGGLIINVFLIGLIAGSLANKLHDLCHSIKALRFRGP